MPDPNSGIPRRAIAGGAITPKKLDEQTSQHWTYFMATKFELPNVVKYNDPGVGVPVPATDTYSTALFKNGPVTVRFLDTTSPISPNKNLDNRGLIISEVGGTSTGHEYCWAAFPETVTGHDAGDPFIYTVGASKPMMIRFKGKLVDVEDTWFRLGFRKGQATPGAFDDMTDAAALSVLGDNTQDGPIFTQKILNDAANVDVDTGLTWTSEEEHEFKVTIGIPQMKTGVGPAPGASSAGVVRFFVDGVEVGSPFNFDDGDEVFPILWHQDNGGGTGTDAELSELEVAFFEDIDDYYIN